jgi:hypothetical protein
MVRAASSLVREAIEQVAVSSNVRLNFIGAFVAVLVSLNQQRQEVGCEEAYVPDGR